MSINGAETPVSPLAPRLGLWMTIAAFLTFIVYTFCFIAILLSSPLFFWTTLADYIAYAGEHGGLFRSLAQFAMLLFSVSFVVLLNCIHECTNTEQKLLTRISIGFGLLFAVTIGIHYFTQLSAVRLNLLRGQIEGLEHFVQANPYSILSAINMLGWTIFLGLASLFVAPVFSGTRLERLIRLVFLLNALFCFGGGIGYIGEIEWLVFVTITLGMGAAVSVTTAALTIWFSKMEERLGHGDE